MFYHFYIQNNQKSSINYFKEYYSVCEGTLLVFKGSTKEEIIVSVGTRIPGTGIDLSTIGASLKGLADRLPSNIIFRIGSGRKDISIANDGQTVDLAGVDVRVGNTFIAAESYLIPIILRKGILGTCLGTSRIVLLMSLLVPRIAKPKTVSGISSEVCIDNRGNVIRRVFLLYLDHLYSSI